MTSRDPQGVFDPTTLEAMPSPDVTEVTLLRHGAVATGASGPRNERIVRGQLDVALSAEGERQHECLAAWLARSSPAPHWILSSDLTRCARLAERIGRAAGVAVEASPLLREQDMGLWQGRSWSDVQQSEGAAINAYWDDYVDARPPEGESLRQLSDRVCAFWDENQARFVHGHVVLVTHIGVVRCLLSHWLATPLDQALRWAPSVGSATRLLIGDAGAVLCGFGERPWSFEEQPE